MGLFDRLFAYDGLFDSVSAQNGLYGVLILVFVITGKYIYALPHKLGYKCGKKFEPGDATDKGGSVDRSKSFYVDYEMTEADNPAVIIGLAGFYFGIIELMLNAIQGSVDTVLWKNLMWVVIWTLVGIALMMLSQWLTILTLLEKRNMRELIYQKNLAAGIIEAAMYISTSLIVGGAISGEPSENRMDDFILCGIYYVLGQLCLSIYILIYKLITVYDDIRNIAEGNAAAAIALGAHIVSCSYIINNPVTKVDSVYVFGLWYVIGVIIMLLQRVFIDKLILPGSRLDDEIDRDANWGAAIIEAGLLFSSVTLLGKFLPDECSDDL